MPAERAMEGVADHMSGARVGVEIGGTFTDLVWVDKNGTVGTGKTPSTPSAIQEAVLTVIAEAGVPLAEVEQVTHGSTVATNALLTRKGAHTGLITTAGFRDVLILGRAERDHGIYDMQYRRPPPPIRRAMIREVVERMGPDGEVLVPLDLDGAWKEIEALIATGIDGIAVSLLHAYRNPTHEKQLAKMIRQRAPHVAVSASHEVSPEFREYERSVTTVVNAFVGPVVERYVERLDDGLATAGYGGVLQIMQSNGGAMPAASAGSNAVRMLLSGPAAGVRAAIWFARRNGIKDILTLDMGGTSTDVAIAPDLVAGMVAELKIDGLPLRTASMDMATIGAGGGSIATMDRGSFLAVGPESAGAVPGPVCYGRGGDKPTVTDAQLVAGLLQPGQFFGGQMDLDVEAACRSLESLGIEGGVEAAADAVLRHVNSNMAGAVRLVSAGRGIDPREFTLVAYGGGGPLHAAMVAEELAIKQVLVPWSPGLASAFGLLIADTLIDTAVSDLHPLSDETLNAARLAELVERSTATALEHGLETASYSIEIGLDMRYQGQAFELTVWTERGAATAVELRTLFEAEHRIRYGYARPKLSVEVVSYRMRIKAPSGATVTTPLPSGKRTSPRTITVAIGGMKQEARSMLRDALGVGECLAGPAIIGEPTSTIVVPDGWQAQCLPSGDLLLRDMR